MFYGRRINFEQSSTSSTIPSLLNQPTLKSYINDIYNKDIGLREISKYDVYKSLSVFSPPITTYLFHHYNISNDTLHIEDNHYDLFDTDYCCNKLDKLLDNHLEDMIILFPEFVNLSLILLTMIDIEDYKMSYKKLFVFYWLDDIMAQETIMELKTASKNLPETIKTHIHKPDIILNIAILLFDLYLKITDIDLKKSLISDIQKGVDINMSLLMTKFEEAIDSNKNKSSESLKKIVDQRIKDQIKIKDIMIMAYILNQFKK